MAFVLLHNNSSMVNFKENIYLMTTDGCGVKKHHELLLRFLCNSQMNVAMSSMTSYC
jgi:hypothetical protein